MIDCPSIISGESLTNWFLFSFFDDLMHDWSEAFNETIIPSINHIILFFRICRDEAERQPLSSNGNGVKKGSIVESDGKVSLGEIIGKNSAV